MIAIDTNVLVRYVVGDDPVQSAQAARFLEDALTPESPGFVSLIVVVELSWVLARAYRASGETVRDVLRRLLESRQIVVQSADVVERALTPAEGDLADALIHHLGVAAGCDRTVTFDRRFARMAGVERLR